MNIRAMSERELNNVVVNLAKEGFGFGDIVDLFLGCDVHLSKQTRQRLRETVLAIFIRDLRHTNVVMSVQQRRGRINVALVFDARSERFAQLAAAYCGRARTRLAQLDFVVVFTGTNGSNEAECQIY